MAEQPNEYRQRIQSLRRMAKASKHAEEAKLFEQLADFYERKIAEQTNRTGNQD